MNNKLRALPWRPSVRHLVGACIVALCVAYLVLRQHPAASAWTVPAPRKLIGPGPRHAIQRLMAEADARCETLAARRSLDVATAAARYRQRRRRHPPPGFDTWFRAARRADAVVVEDFFDRIDKDLTPFWALEPAAVRARARAAHLVRVRNGTAVAVGDVDSAAPSLRLWTGLVDGFARHLPDVDMPVEGIGGPRVLVPFDDVAELVRRADRQRSVADVADVTDAFGPLDDHAAPQTYEPRWNETAGAYWDMAVQACGAHTPAFAVSQIDDFSPPAAVPADWRPDYALGGFVRNWTAAIDPCMQSHLRQLHDAFVEPLNLSSTQELVPLFGGSKLPLNNEILIPAAVYLADDASPSDGEPPAPPWHRKEDRLLWRGDASGGRAHEHTWHRFQRHRLVDMLNGTTVSRVEASGLRAATFDLPPRADSVKLGPWLDDFADAAFVHLCPPGECDFLDSHFSVAEEMSLSAQYKYKFLPDADGDSLSARFRRLLRSTSLPLKATIYAEWHDDRLVPWAHFVPLDNTFRDLYRVLDFFADGPGGPGDAAAASIAKRGRLWAERVLRREDMGLYVWRLLLEWARVCDDNRHHLGYVGDLAP